MGNTTCTNGHSMLDGDAFCGDCGSPAAPEAPPLTSPPAETTAHSEQAPALACPEGHPNPEDHLYCGACGAMLTPPRPPDGPAMSAAGDPEPKGHSYRRIWSGVGLVAVAVAAVVIVSNRDSGSHSSSDGTESHDRSRDESESLGTTSLGCDVLPMKGTDSTMVDPPYCTQVKLIEEKCGWPEDEVSYPPEVSGGVIRFTRLNPSYPLGAATFSSQGAGGPYERFALQCIGGYGNGLYFWTPQEWDALLRPS